jgi:hypothetical protein
MNTFQRAALACAVSLLPALSSLAAAPWHHPLCLANHGYWPTRIPVQIFNDGTNAAKGDPVALPAGPLAGTRAESFRACDANGQELLFDILDDQGEKKRVGQLTATDRLMVPADCAARSSVTIYLYAGNDDAAAVPDFLWPRDMAPRSGAAGQSLRTVAGAVETLRLDPPPPGMAPGFSAAWPVRALVRVMNVNARALDPVLVLADLRPTLGRWLKIPAGAEARVVQAGSGVEIPSWVRSENNLLFSTALPPQSIREFYVYLNPAAKPSREKTAAGYSQLLTNRLNLAPGLHADGTPSADWIFSDEPNRRKFGAGPGRAARFGQASLEFTIPTNGPASWTGWRSREIPVRPGTSYFYGGYLQAAGLDGSTALHAHWHAKGGQLAATSAYVGTQPAVSGDSDWTQSSALVQAPPDAATIQLHLTMNTHGTLRHDGVLFCEVQPGEVVRLETSASKAHGSGLHVWQANPLVKVFPDDPPAPPVQSVVLECARNEFEPCQLVACCGQTVHGLQVTVSPLRNGRGEALGEVKVERVGYVPVDHPSSYYDARVADWCRKLPRGAGSTDGWAGSWPDPLLPGRACDVPAGRNQPFWLTVRTTRETAAGEYRGEVVFRADGLAPVAVPLTVNVLAVALPERTQLKAIFDFRFGPGGDFGSGKKAEADRRRWLRFMAEHRLGVDAVEPAPAFKREQGQVTMDAAAFDEAARYCFDELGMNAAYTPSFFYQFGWAYPPKKFFGLEPFTPEYNHAFKQAYRLFSTHLREKGWHDRFVYYISDEPHFQNAFVVEQMKKLCALVHEVDPKLPIYSSTWRHCPVWDSSLDIWGVGQFGCFPVPELEALRRAGHQFWFTCDGQMATDTPYLATERMLPYYCFKYGGTGFEFWGLAWWTRDPWQYGWHTFIRQSDEGKNYYWVRYPNGDGYLAYPGQPVGVEGPVSTIRLEQVREGLEDYEAVSLLAGLVEKAKAAGRPAVSGERALALAKDLVTIPNAGGLRSTEILPDPDQIPVVRKAVNAAIGELMR